MDNLKCNRLTCRKALTEKAVVVSVSLNASYSSAETLLFVRLHVRFQQYMASCSLNFSWKAPISFVVCVYSVCRISLELTGVQLIAPTSFSTRQDCVQVRYVPKKTRFNHSPLNAACETSLTEP